jgi:hypothetical protein
MQRIIEILRQWEMPLAILFAYYVLAASFIWFVHRRWCSKRRAANPRRYRFIFALVLAVVFAPSVISDFWLFTIPGLAILELLLLLPSIVLHPWITLYVISIVCLLPMVACFGIFYFALWFRDRRLSNAQQTVYQAMQRTATGA